MLNIWVAEGQQDESKLSWQYATLLKTKTQIGYSDAGNEISAWLKSKGGLLFTSVTLELSCLLWIAGMAVATTRLLVNACDPPGLSVPRSVKGRPWLQGVQGPKQELAETYMEVLGSKGKQSDYICQNWLLICQTQCSNSSSITPKKHSESNQRDDDEIPHTGVWNISPRYAWWIHLARHYPLKQK